MKKRFIIAGLLFGLLMLLLTPIFAAAVTNPEPENRFFIGICPLIWAIVGAGFLFLWVGWKAKGKIYRWLKTVLPRNP
jgi:Na+/H+ antiporter NhaD/arsenite permease-like protein